MASFVLGIKAEAERLKALGIEVGEPLADEHPLKDTPSGEEVAAVQATSRGLFFYDKPGGIVHFFQGAGR